MAANRSNDAEAKSRREAFIFLYLNLFETLFIDYNRTLRRTALNIQHWQSWNAWIHSFFAGSSEARAMFADPISQRIFAADFVTYANGVLKEVKGPDITRR